MNQVDLPDSTTERLRETHKELQRVEEEWQKLLTTTLEMAGVDPQEAQVDLQRGVITIPKPDEES